MDNLFEQMTAISKAGAYDALVPHVKDLKAMVRELTAKLEHVNEAYSDLMTEDFCAQIDTLVKKAKLLSI